MNTCLLSLKTENTDIPQTLPTNIFSDIKNVDAHHWAPGEEKKPITTLLDISFKNLLPRDIGLILLQSQTIKTFDHLSSEICLLEEKNTATEYIGHYQGSHTYCTNECVTENYTFSININKINGEIFLTH